ncbi:MAG: hypothetical protein OXH08_07175 [Gammaproteobacteria bacterium]|nr:hypothetical protein [Gammaproteobacteria bacterium]
MKDLLAIRGFGWASLLDLMCIAEAAPLVRMRVPIPTTTAEVVVPAVPAQVPVSATTAETPSTRAEVGHVGTAWGEVADVLQLLIAAASEFHGATTVADALELDLANLASDLGITQAVDSHRIQDLTDVRIVGAVISAIRDLQATLPDRKITILDQYLYARTRKTLEELGQAFGVTRERVRQIKNKLAAEIEKQVGPEVSVIVAILGRKAGPVVSEDNLRLVIDALFEGEPGHDPAVDLTRRIVGAALEYDCVKGVCANRTARRILKGFRKHAVELADEVGLIDEEALLASLPDKEWRHRFELSIERCGFVRVSDRLVLRSTRKARAKAAILTIGRLATLDEIAAESNLPRTHLGGLLSSIPGIARASKTKWGIEDWIEDEYEGIAAEIKQRIDEDGGATTMDRLVRELPQMFEVKEGSVRAIASTPQFVLSDGIVRLAEESEVTLRDIHDVIDGVTAEGWPYWSFLVHERYFEGYSLSGVPPEIAHALGCPRNGSVRAVVSRPTGCRRVSVNWHLTSLSGASVGYISTALNRLGVGEGDRVCLVVVRPGVVEFRVFDRERGGQRGRGRRRRVGGARMTTAGENDDRSSVLLERLKRRRRVL